MSSRCLEAWPGAALALLLGLVLNPAPPARAQPMAAPPPLRVCSDPDNLPLSHADGSGFENRIAAVLAQALGRPLRPQWQPLRRGFVRKTVGEGLCDVFIGVPAGFGGLSTTRPYYRSTYVLVTRADEPHPLAGFDDPRLAALRIGVQLPGEDGAATPPGHALARQGAIDRVRGYPPYGTTPAARRLLDDLGRGVLDAAFVWGPQAAPMPAGDAVPLRRVAARPPPGLAGLPFEFDIAVGVRRGNLDLRDALQAALDAQRGRIDAILAAYGVPRTDGRAQLDGSLSRASP